MKGNKVTNSQDIPGSEWEWENYRKHNPKHEKWVKSNSCSQDRNEWEPGGGRTHQFLLKKNKYEIKKKTISK